MDKDYKAIASKALGVHYSDLEEINCFEALRWLVLAIATGEHIESYKIGDCYVVDLEDRTNPIAIVSCIDGEIRCYEVLW